MKLNVPPEATAFEVEALFGVPSFTRVVPSLTTKSRREVTFCYEDGRTTVMTAGDANRIAAALVEAGHHDRASVILAATRATLFR